MRTVRVWGPAIVWMAVIFFFSTRQRITVSPQYAVNFLFFKTLHVLEYALLFLLYYRATKKPLLAFVLTVTYASTDEIHQLFVATREGTVRDVIIDSAGAAFAWITLTKLLPKMPRRLQSWVKILLG